MKTELSGIPSNLEKERESGVPNCLIQAHLM